MGGVLVLTGPTATGKTALGIMLAERLGGEIVSADSMQIYRGMEIGSAAPTAEEMRGVPHHLIGFLDPREAYSVGRYVEDASAAVEDILARGKLPIIVGGTLLYIESLLAGRDFTPLDTELRASLENEYDALGGEAMLERLRRVDPRTALHPNDKKRVVRALEIYELTGKTKTEFDELSRLAPPRWPSVRIALDFADRADLYARIDARVDRMFAAGLVAETEALLASGVDDRATSMQAIGYKELVPALRGETTLEAAREDIKRASRRYAKRQLSWLRGDADIKRIVWESAPDFERAAAISTEFAREGGIM
ncbi:MAG: tRNA (adenosine(37)-N6)-dimethylallyltransferase MiaA [Oscillospiraceae bacterium]|nr:tRNA (adenosine(37)-N6)-dimethylallyltransferase MiaA [Oscillospiraceae bacterium]